MADTLSRAGGWLADHDDEMLEAVQESLRIASVRGEGAPGAPYGPGPRAALTHVLELCAKLGMRIQDFGGHAGHAEFGDGDEMVAVLGHLDVVPAGAGWVHDPFGGDIEGGYVYGRGAEDDKGPTVAALFGAASLLATGAPLRRRVRVIFGCDEESGFGCMRHYFGEAGAERPKYGFTPDAMFPLVFAEKGILTFQMERTTGPDSDRLRVVSAEGGLRSNMVPDTARATVAGSEAEIAEIANALRDQPGVSSERRTVDEMEVIAEGRSAHGSTPELGHNAIGALSAALGACAVGLEPAWFGGLAALAEIGGRGLNVAGADDVCGALTCNLGLLALHGGVCRITLNIRYPVTWSGDEVIHQATAAAERLGWEVTHTSDSPPLYVPLDSEPSRTLLRVYRETTGDADSEPLTMGGGTYARVSPGLVAFGPAIPGGLDGPAHEPEERIAIETLRRCSRMYARALLELANAQG